MNIAVIIPVYNRSTIVIEALQSVLDQELAPDTVVVIDDGSTDDLLEILDHWRGTHCLPFRLEVLSQGNKGASHARNAGIERVKRAKYIHFLDSDDLIPRNFYARTFAFMQNNDNHVAVTCDLKQSGPGRDHINFRSPKGLDADAVRWFYQHDGGVGSASFFRTESVLTAGGFPEHVPTGHDSYLFLRIALLGDWGILRGLPVIKQCGNALKAGKEDHIANRYPDRRLRWAEIHEEFATGPGRDRVEGDSAIESALARWWKKAGREQLRLKEYDQAVACFTHSIKWDRRARTIINLFLAYVLARLSRVMTNSYYSD